MPRVVVETVDSQRQGSIAGHGPAGDKPLAPASESALVHLIRFLVLLGVLVLQETAPHELVRALAQMVRAPQESAALPAQFLRDRRFQVLLLDPPDRARVNMQGQDRLRVLVGEQLRIQWQTDDGSVVASEVAAEHRVGGVFGVVAQRDVVLCLVAPEADVVWLLAGPHLEAVIHAVIREDLRADRSAGLPQARVPLLEIQTGQVHVHVVVCHDPIVRLADKGLYHAVACHVTTAGHAVVDDGQCRIVLHDHGIHAADAHHEQVAGDGHCSRVQCAWMWSGGGG